MRTAILLLLLTLTGFADTVVVVGRAPSAAPSFSGTQYYVNTTVADGGDGTVGNPWNNLRDAFIAGVNTQLASTAIRINVTGSTNDTLNVVQAHWDTFTNATTARYIEILGDATSGAWDDSKYVMEVTNASAVYNNKPAFVRIRNVQFKLNNSNAGAPPVLRLSTANVGVGEANPDCRFEDSLIWINRTGSGRPFGIYHSNFAEGSVGQCLNRNIVIFDKGTGGIGVDGDGGTGHRIHDSILAACQWYCFGTGVFKNCVGPIASDAGAFLDEQAGTEYCAAADTSASGTGARNSQDFSSSFTDSANGDYRPLVGDTTMRDVGSTTATTDIRGLGRPAGAADDIGPFEYQ